MEKQVTSNIIWSWVGGGRGDLEKGFTMYWCGGHFDCVTRTFAPHPKESPYEIGVQLARWFQRRRCYYKMLMDGQPTDTSAIGLSSGELKTHTLYGII